MEEDLLTDVLKQLWNIMTLLKEAVPREIAISFEPVETCGSSSSRSFKNTVLNQGERNGSRSVDAMLPSKNQPHIAEI